MQKRQHQKFERLHGSRLKNNIWEYLTDLHWLRRLLWRLKSPHPPSMG